MKRLSPDEIKRAVRKEALKRRAGIPLEVRRTKDAAIKERLLALDEYKDATALFIYASFGSEPETLGIISDALGEGKRVMVPLVNKDDMSLEIHEIRNSGDLRPGYMGIPEPEGRAETRRALKEADIVVMPGAAFDPEGARLGFGKGCYDKLLSGAPDTLPLVALAYEEQIVDKVPSEAHDIRVGKILTEERTIECHER